MALNAVAMNLLQADSPLISLKELSEPINLNNAYPVTDEIGITNKAYKFMLINESDLDVTYNLNFIEEEKTLEYKRLPINNLKYYLVEDNMIIIDKLNMNSDTLATVNLKAHESKKYELKIWIDYRATNEIMGTSLHRKVSISK